MARPSDKCRLLPELIIVKVSVLVPSTLASIYRSLATGFGIFVGTLYSMLILFLYLVAVGDARSLIGLSMWSASASYPSLSRTPATISTVPSVVLLFINCCYALLLLRFYD